MNAAPINRVGSVTEPAGVPRPTPGPAPTNRPAEPAQPVGRRPPAARLRGLRKEYRPSAVALDSVDLDLPAGSVLGLVGPNGAGKTTLLRLLLGLARPTAGSVELLGEPMPAKARAVLPWVGALVEGSGFLPYLSGRANLARCAAAEPLLAGGGLRRAVTEALGRVGLTDDAADRPYRGYPPGLRQRLGLATALLVPRRLVVLDEPTNGLDPAGTRDVRRLITEVHASGSTVLVSSDSVTEVERTCTHVAVLVAGSVVATGELTGLLAEGAALEVTTTEPDAALAALRAARIIGYTERGRLLADLADTQAEEVLRTLFRAGIPVSEARRRTVGLAELFARLTEDNEDNG